MAMGKPWHPECFRCTVCVKPLQPDNFKEHDGKPYCEKDYNNLFAPKCAGCKGPIVDVSRLFLLFLISIKKQIFYGCKLSNMVLPFTLVQF